MKIGLDIGGTKCAVSTGECEGGVFMRNADLFMPIVDPILDREALPLARKACRIVPAGLGENIGDYAALAVSC